MSIDVACPGCGKSYTQPESQLGKRARCKRCGEEFRIVLPDDVAPSEPEPTPPAPPPRPRPPAAAVRPKAPTPTPDTIPVSCPSCGFGYDVDAALAGKRARCKSCGEVFRLPEAGQAVRNPPVAVARPIRRAGPDLFATAPEELPTFETVGRPTPEHIPVAKAVPIPPQRSPYDLDPDWPEEEEEVGWLARIAAIPAVRAGAIAMVACVVVVLIGVVARSFQHGGAPKVEAAADDLAFDPFAGNPPPGQPIREAVIRPHRDLCRELADAAQELLPTREAATDPSDRDLIAKTTAFETKLAELNARRSALPGLNSTEEYRLFSEFSPRMIEITTRHKAALERLLARVPADSPDSAKIRGQMSRLDGATTALRAGLNRSQESVPSVDVIFPSYADPDGLVGEAIGERLKTLTDRTPPVVFTVNGGGVAGRSKTGYRVGPVADPEAFSRKLGLGKARLSGGRKIVVTDVQVPAASLAAARKARASRQKQPAPQPVPAPAPTQVAEATPAPSPAETSYDSDAPAAAPAETPAPSAPGPRWVVLLRGRDPAAWDTDGLDGTFAKPLTAAPAGVKYVRLKRMDTGEAIIVPATRADLAKEQPAGGSGPRWNGTNRADWGARHLGIGEGEIVRGSERQNDGVVFVQTAFVDGYVGSGFGHEHHGDGRTQHYAWHGKKIAPVAFEIAVTAQELTPDERRALLEP